MINFSAESRIVITCLKRLSPFVAREINNLGYQATREFATGVELNGSLNDCIRLNLHLRCASQVHYSLGQFRIDSAEALYQKILAYPWEDLIPTDSFFSVTSNVDHFTINNPLFVNVKVKDAIVDRLRSKTGKRPNSGADKDKIVINLYWKGRDAEVFLDTSGESLARHGYRKIPGKAPMLEALAAAAIMATRWNADAPFVNPMCGAGTIAIEAALMATNRFPGLFRNNYSFMHVDGYDDSTYNKEEENLHDQIKSAPGLKVIATDHSAEMIKKAKTNAKVAGVDHLIDFAVCDFSETVIPEHNGVLFFNPEYGERMGEVEQLQSTYEDLGAFMKKKAGGYYGYVFTGNLDLAKNIGLKPSRRTEFYSAKLDCRLLEYELYEGSRRKPKG